MKTYLSRFSTQANINNNTVTTCSAYKHGRPHMYRRKNKQTCTSHWIIVLHVRTRDVLNQWLTKLQLVSVLAVMIPKLQLRISKMQFWFFLKSIIGMNHRKCMFKCIACCLCSNRICERVILLCGRAVWWKKLSIFKHG